MRTRDAAATAVFAALYAAGSLLPGFPLVGIQGSSIPLVRALEITYGVLMGPLLGPAAALLGSLAGKFMTGGGANLVTVPLAPVAAFVAACASRRRVWGLPGWIPASAVLAATILSWYTTGTGGGLPLYPALHAASLVALLLLRERIPDWIHSADPKKIAAGVAAAGLPATLAGHILGGVTFITLYGTPGSVYAATQALSALERGTLTVLAVAVTVPLLVVVRRAFPDFEQP